jgi:hypothetical protein
VSSAASKHVLLGDYVSILGALSCGTGIPGVVFGIAFLSQERRLMHATDDTGAENWVGNNHGIY